MSWLEKLMDKEVEELCELLLGEHMNLGIISRSQVENKVCFCGWFQSKDGSVYKNYEVSDFFVDSDEQKEDCWEFRKWMYEKFGKDYAMDYLLYRRCLFAKRQKILYLTKSRNTYFAFAERWIKNLTDEDLTNLYKSFLRKDEELVSLAIQRKMEKEKYILLDGIINTEKGKMRNGYKILDFFVDCQNRDESMETYILREFLYEKFGKDYAETYLLHY